MFAVIIIILSSFSMFATTAQVPAISVFLRNVRSHLKGPLNQAYNVVLGNEACDADSIISSICYAHYRHEYNSNGLIIIPVASIARMDLPFRREVKILLDKVGMDLTDLVLAEELPLDLLLENNRVALTLVDHNTLGAKYTKFGGCVTEILDHHFDNGNYAAVDSAYRQIAFDANTGKALVGSTCTLIAEKYFASGVPMGQDIATLLLGVIALDTINMSENAGIGTERDRLALQRLREISPHSQDELFVLLRDAKLDPVFWNELSVADVLRIDYKAFKSPTMNAQGLGSVGIAAALQPLKDFLLKEHLCETVYSALKSQGLSMVVVMSFVHEPQPRREILLCTPDKSLLDATTQYLLRTDLHDFRCSVLVEDDQRLRELLLAGSGSDVCDDYASPAAADGAPAAPLYGAVLHQGNSKASRKQLAPELLKFFDNYVTYSK